jgi:hypothetical protein
MCGGVGESHLSGESANPQSRKEGSIGADMGGVRVGGLAARCEAVLSQRVGVVRIRLGEELP